MKIYGHEIEVLHYGEPLEDDECICDIHGCRLSYHGACGRWLCDSCREEAGECDEEEARLQYDQQEELSLCGHIKQGEG